MLSTHLDTLRRKADMSYKQLASVCNVSEATISRICSGETVDPAFSTVVAIVAACGGSLDEIAGISSPRQDTTALDALERGYRERIACIKEENQAHVQEILSTLDTYRQEAAQRESELTRSGNRTVKFVIAATAALMIAQGIIDIILLRVLL
jgi:transcriptional regulator with XRE-family HTH domain